MVEKLKQNSTKLSKISCSFIGGVFDLLLNQFPNTVRIETTNACNAKCIICPHQKMQRPIMSLDEALYKRIIDECSDHKCGDIHLHNFGEPLLDKNLAEHVRYAKKKGIKKVTIFSNGALLTTNKAKELLDAGLDEIKISFDGASKEEFEKIRIPLKFENIVTNTKELVRLRNLKKVPLKIRVACHSTSDKNETIRSLENCVDEFFFGSVHNWADSEIDPAEISKVRKPCSRLWWTFTILSNGYAALCCLDYEGKVILGDLHKSSIFEIWNNEQYKQMRLFHKKSQQDKIEICKHCSKSFW